ncbi:hypothetical protein KP509_11G019600 [Ceratopteris richardii]|uniref:Protein kinase domain-containing protein n=1 Tax=Ceratopteris richardii TaxID=49495 RepID=A0A8T2TQW2_CERRI|nr:hypothetical protein KP509_11G019600 [Ceratopteris richardii]
MTITVRSMLMRLSTAHESLHLAPHNPSVTTESFSSPSANVNASSCSRQSLFHKLLSRFCQWKKESAEKSSSINDTHNPYVDSQDHFTLSICSDSPLDFTHSNGNESCEPSGVFNDSQQCSSYDRYQRHRSCSYFMPLLAYCLRKENRFLVLNGAYEHDLATALKLSTENWKIARWISGSISNYSGSHYKTCRPLLFLDWIRRLKIATQVAEALHFLHHICEPPIAHRDLTASSILLTDEFDIRMGYLEEARILDRGEAPAHDIYSYGKLLLQLVFGCETTRNIQPEDILGIIPPDLNDFMDLSNNPNQNSAFLHLIDPSLDLNEDLMKQVLGVASIAKSCMQACTKLSMDDISRLIQDPQHVNLEF